MFQMDYAFFFSFSECEWRTVEEMDERHCSNLENANVYTRSALSEYSVYEHICQNLP